MPVLFTPGGVNSLDDNELKQTLDAVDAGTALSAEQEQVANALRGAAPTAGNVFSAGSAPANIANPAKPILGATVGSDQLAKPSDTSRRIQDFLGSLQLSEGLSTPQGATLNPGGTSTGGTVAGTGLDLSKLLFPNFDLAAITGTGRNTTAPNQGVLIGDQNLAEEVENLRLKSEKQKLLDEQHRRHVQSAVKRGVIPQALKSRTRAGDLINQPGDFGLSKSNIPQSLRSQLFPGPQITGVGSIIGTSRPRSIIGR